MTLRRALALTAALTLSCGAETPDAPATGWTMRPSAPYRTLAEWRLFEGNGATQRASAGVVPYTVISPLFSDFTAKLRFVAVPPGRRITYRADGDWVLPEGSVLVKTFAYPRDARTPSLGLRLLETRLLVRTAEGWIPNTYVWNEAQTEAIRQVAAPPVNLSWIDATGATRTNEYIIPNTNQCLTCHGQRGHTAPLAMRTDQLNRAGEAASAPNQIDDLAARGLFDTMPPPAAMRVTFASPSDERAPIEARARAYLHANCAHCHNPRDTSTASVTGLNLEASERRPIALGVCRRPSMAGGTGTLAYDVVPGHPERSVMLFRMRTSDARARMPSLGVNFNDEDGARLVERWIMEMTGDACDATP